MKIKIITILQFVKVILMIIFLWLAIDLYYEAKETMEMIKIFILSF